MRLLNAPFAPGKAKGKGKGQRSMPRGSKYRICKDYLVPNTMKGMVFGTRVLKDWVLEPSRIGPGGSMGSSLDLEVIDRRARACRFIWLTRSRHGKD